MKKYDAGHYDALPDFSNVPEHLRPKFRDTRSPSVLGKAVNAARAATRVVKAAASGKPLHVPAEEREQRLAICRDCNFWNEGGNLGLGECMHVECGCTRVKHRLVTETCPLGKWDT